MAVLRSEIGLREVGSREISQSELESATEALKNVVVMEKSRVREQSWLLGHVSDHQLRKIRMRGVSLSKNGRNLAIFGAVIAGMTLATSLGGCSSCSRWQKSVVSDYSGGLMRKVTLYSTTGDVLGAWEGKIDLDNSENEIFFDLDGKRVIIHGGIVVVEEI